MRAPIRRPSHKGRHMVDQILLTLVELGLKMGVKVGWVYRRTRQGAVDRCLPYL